jgi:hypothetical protein
MVMLRTITQQMQDDKRDFNRRMDDLVSHADIATVVQRTIAENLEMVINPMVKKAVSDAMATTIDLHNMDNAGAANEEDPAINAVSQQLENENRTALEGGQGDRRVLLENKNTMAELFGDMCIQSEPLRTLDEFKGGVLYRSSLMPNPNGTGVVGVGYGYDRGSVKPAYYLSASGNWHDMSGRAPMMCFNCENKDVSDDEKYHWRIQCPYAIGNPTITLSYP